MGHTFLSDYPTTSPSRSILATQLRGRLGLCLSGGGLRASFLHLGLLARMAECDMLRDVEAISCTSGGAIVGSVLYLQIKELLERKVRLLSLSVLRICALFSPLRQSFLARVFFVLVFFSSLSFLFFGARCLFVCLFV